MQSPTGIKAAGSKRFRGARDGKSHTKPHTPAPAAARTKARKPLATVCRQSLPLQTTSKPAARYSIGMFSPGEARSDRWQSLAHAAQTLAARATAGSSRMSRSLK